MKPIAKCPLEEKNHFLTLLIGKCWHEWESRWHYWQCRKCKKRKTYGLSIVPFDYYRDLSGFQIVKEYMETHMPKVWSKYLDHQNKVEAYKFGSLKGLLNAILNLDNFIAYLLEHTEWAYFDYPDYQTGEARQGKHPALLFAEGKEE